MQSIRACFELKTPNQNLIDFILYDQKPFKYSFTPSNNAQLDDFIKKTISLKAFANKSETTPELFDLAYEQLCALNRIARSESDWIVYALYRCALQLYQIAVKLDTSAKNEDNNKPTSTSINAISNPSLFYQKGDLRQDNFLTVCARVINSSLTICLQDRDLSASNKRHGAYFFGIIMFKIFNRLRAYELLNHIVNVLESRSDRLPPDEAFGNRRALTVAYSYYLGRYYTCRKKNYEKALQWLELAFKNSHSKCSRQREQILVYLLPVAFLKRRRFPTKKLLDSWDAKSTGLDYKSIFTAVLNGNLSQLDLIIESSKLSLLQRGLYLTFSELKPYATLRLVRAAWVAVDCKWQVPTHVIATAIKIKCSAPHPHPDDMMSQENLDKEEQLDRTECQVAGLISQGLIRGYLSHGNRVLVLSRTVPFPCN
ncbi:HHR220Wp [Eremothecium sinecaudum]|uniref:HHR220Wp n=1 Tax=Eremothecium sinecaudum TaxID=45286 RepID=A0A0X8HWZ8_9SACH|nr:HHR220Wp [Eremothecium sinecaudum]AMD22989.1 HHR220Wp [Eremothecium sinecaudum]